MNKKLLVVLLVMAGFTTISVFAYHSNQSGIKNHVNTKLHRVMTGDKKDTWGTGKFEKFGSGEMINSGHWQAIQTALQNKDYATRQTLMGTGGMKGLIDTQDKFNMFVDMHIAIQKGDKATAQKLATQLGLDKLHMGGERMIKGKRNHKLHK